MRIAAIILSLIPFFAGAQLTLSRVSTGQGQGLEIPRGVDRDEKWIVFHGQSNSAGRVSASSWRSDLQDTVTWAQVFFSRQLSYTPGQEYRNMVAGENASAGEPNRETVNGLDIALQDYLPFFAPRWRVIRLATGGASLVYLVDSPMNVGVGSAEYKAVDSAQIFAPNIEWNNALLIWQQGESEAAGDSLKATVYSLSLDSMITDIREITDPNLLVIIPKVNQELSSGTYPWKAIVAAQQDNSAARDSRVFTVDANSTSLLDAVHYNAAAFYQIARDVAAVYYREITRIKIN